MTKIKINKDKVIKFVAKMLSDKELVCWYMKGKTSKNALSKNGIKLGNPLPFSRTNNCSHSYFMVRES